MCVIVDEFNRNYRKLEAATQICVGCKEGMIGFIVEILCVLLLLGKMGGGGVAVASTEGRKQ